ncbi:hypothetical protein HFD88_009842 [Aspergillus terreus]|nr:hypothetical protein HFD88_009842 [Aspergillus terreus]
MDSTSQSHSRNLSRASRPRSSTRGPLDQPDDPLSPGASASPLSQMRTSQVLDTCSGASFSALDPLAPGVSQSDIEKDLSYLLRYDIYHPLAQVDIPPALRSEFLAPTSDQSLQSCLASLERLLTEGHFLLAAYLSAKILTSSLISPTDVKLILALFYTRLASLELSGNTVLAAQESKALEDLSSAFYYIEPGPQVPESGDTQKHPTYARHIVPWCLRVLAIRLQSIGFGDSRRGIGGLYEIGLEARREIMRPDLTDEERRIWKERLSDLGIRSVNALIEMGDLNAARRSLSSLRTPTKQVVGDPNEAENSIFPPLLSMAEGRYDDAVAGWRALLGREPKRSDESMISQNLAARQVLEELVRENNSFGSLVFNLSTVYELCSDKSPNMKAELVDVISKQPVTGHTNLDRPNADFKL